MELFAVTYTDSSEPWGRAILDRKLYRTPGELLTAYNACYDEFVTGRCGDEVREYYADPVFARNHAGRTLDDVLEEEFSREYGVGKYTLVDP